MENRTIQSDLNIFEQRIQITLEYTHTQHRNRESHFLMLRFQNSTLLQNFKLESILTRTAYLHNHSRTSFNSNAYELSHLREEKNTN